MMKILTAAVIVSLSLPAVAQDAQKNSQAESTRIEVDQENHRILFFIEGELQAVLEKGQLSIDGNILSKAVLHGDMDKVGQEETGIIK